MTAVHNTSGQFYRTEVSSCWAVGVMGCEDLVERREGIRVTYILLMTRFVHPREG